MASELPKAYKAAAVQAEVAAVWEQEKSFHAEPTDPGEPYSIVIPPPNVTAALHLGHALNNTIQDILIRKARMEGKNAVWLPGTDHAGIATQTVVEKRVMAETGKRRTDFGRDEFVKKIQAWKDEYEQVILGQLKAMGCSCDWDRTAFTMDEPRAKAVREAFFQLFKSGLIYRGKRLVNWDPVTQTALADDEVENEEVDGFFYYLQYPLSDGSGHVTVATTRPETMLGDTAVAINPTDPRAAALKGKSVKLPIVGRVIPIIEDDYVVKPVQHGGDPADTKAQMATGFLKVTPAHDPNDYDIGTRHTLPVINVMAPDGSISDKFGWTDGIGDADFLLGKSRETAREEVVEWFRRHGLLEDVKPYRHSVGHSYRSHVPIEPYLSDQWYCRVTDDRLRGAALRAMTQLSSPSPFAGEGGVGGLERTNATGSQNPSPHPLPQGEGEKDQLTFYPARYAKTYQTWHEDIRDWCISRQLWWGHRIPVWSRPKWDGENYTEQAVRNYFRQFVALPACGNDEAKADAAMDGLAFLYTDTDLHACLRGSEHDDAIIEMMTGSMGYKQDLDVLDTWFSSALWPMSTLGWPEADESATPQGRVAGGFALSKWNPTSVLTTAREIITLWVSRMVMFNEFFLGQIPFKDVFIHAMIQDGEGRKMSKSLGNGVDPLDIISSHGTDAMRFTLTSMCTQTQDVRMPVEKDPTTGKNTSPKFDIGRNFANKVWNAARFVIGQIASLTAGGVASATPSENANDLTLADQWILSRLNRTIDDVNAAIAEYRFDQYAKSCYDFFWGDFCDWYVEAAKPQMKDPARAASTARVLASVLDASLRLMHPMIPFVTEKIWWNLNEIYPDRGVPGRIACPTAPRIIKARWPISSGPIRSGFAEPAEQVFGNIQAIVVAIRNLRSDYKVDAKKSVAVSIKSSDDAAQGILSLKASIETLAICALTAVGSTVTEPTNAAKTSAGGCEIFVGGLIDPEAEKLRHAKRREELTKNVTALKGRLGNAGYLAKAPPNLVKQTQDQLAEAEAELASLG